jgi:hypothetical protein
VCESGLVVGVVRVGAGGGGEGVEATVPLESLLKEVCGCVGVWVCGCGCKPCARCTCILFACVFMCVHVCVGVGVGVCMGQYAAAQADVDVLHHSSSRPTHPLTPHPTHTTHPPTHPHRIRWDSMRRRWQMWACSIPQTSSLSQTSTSEVLILKRPLNSDLHVVNIPGR